MTAAGRALVRPLSAAEHRAGLDLFQQGTGRPAVGDAEWRSLAGTIAPGTMWGALVAGRLVGMLESWPSDLAVPGTPSRSAGGRAPDLRRDVVLNGSPGLRTLPARVFGRLAVHPDFSGRGLARALIQAVLDAADEPAIIMQPRAGGLYQRFGFGASTRGRNITVDTGRAVPHAGAPPAGQVRTICPAEAAALLPDLYQACRDRPGSVRRAASHEVLLDSEAAVAGLELRTVAHSGPEGDDGFVRFVRHRTQGRDILEVWDLHSRTPSAWAALWRFLRDEAAGATVRALLRPVDEPVAWLFTDPRSIQAGNHRDVVWLRPHRVVRLLQARSYGSDERLVLEVTDPLPGTAPVRCLISGDTIRATGRPAQLSVGADAFGALYLGDVRASALAAAGRMTVSDEAAPAVADRLFATTAAPWAGTTL